MERDSFIFYNSFYQAISELPESDRLAVYDAIAQYSLTGEMPELSGVGKAIMTLIRPQIDANKRRYENGRKGAEHGKKGGRPRKNNAGQNPEETPKEENENPEITPKKPQENPNETPNVNDNVKENNNSNELLQKKSEKGLPAVPVKDPLETEFDEFWALYDKKTSRAICLKKWRKLSKADRAAVFRTVRDYVASTPDKQFRKNPETYLNQRGWEMEIIPRTDTTQQNNLTSHEPDRQPNYLKKQF